MTAPHTSILKKDSEISFLQVTHLSSDYVCLKKNRQQEPDIWT